MIPVLIAIGWGDLGNPLNFPTRDKLIEKARAVYPKEKPGTRISWGSQVWKFSWDIHGGDSND